MQNKSRQYALRLLSYRGRSEKELKERLAAKGFPEAEISSALDNLRDLGYIDDLALAEELKREAITRKLLGSDGVRKYLLSRGIPRKIVSVVCTRNGEEDTRNAGKYLEKKLGMIKTYPPHAVKRRLYSQLLRRGYSPAVIMTVLKEISLNEEV